MCRADHEDQEVVLFNRNMLPAYYGLLKLCCLQSRSFTRQLAAHQNVTWALKNVTPHPTQYTLVWIMYLPYVIIIYFLIPIVEKKNSQHAGTFVIKESLIGLYSIIFSLRLWKNYLN